MKTTKAMLWTCLLLTGFCLAGEARAQDAGEIELSRAIVQAKRQEVLTQALNLTEEHSKIFFPIYRDYQTDMAKANDRMLDLTQTIEQSGGKLTDAQASALLDEFMKFQKSKLEVQKKYVGKLKKVLPATVVAKFLQMENRMDAAVQYGLMGSVPLVK